MKKTKDGRLLSTVPAITWWLSDKIEEFPGTEPAKIASSLYEYITDHAK